MAPVTSNALSYLNPQKTEMRVCEKHGEYESAYTKFLSQDWRWTGCPTCDHEKRVEEDKKRVEQELIEDAQRRLDRALHNANIPPRFASKGFDNYHANTVAQKAHLERCKRYVQDFPAACETGLGLLMMGGPGTGKTHLAIATLDAIIRTHRTPGTYITAYRMFRRIKATYDRESEESETEVINRYSRTQLLVLDEIGVSFGSDTEMNYLFDILNYRYEQCLPTIVISNRQPADLSEWMGERVVDRLRECCKAMVFDWESERRDLGSKQP